MKKHTLGLVAHVDAGKTTLCEGMLFQAGKIRKLGRVDHQNTFLDFEGQERKRGITITMKQARLNWEDSELILLDTPGHLDFSSEMERTLQVLDAAVIVLSALDGVQAHTRTIWSLLQRHKIPTFLFINKMDISYYSEEELLNQIHKELSDHCLPFKNPQLDEIALCDDTLLEMAETGELDLTLVQNAIVERKLFPVYFGSALRNEGITDLLNGLTTWLKQKTYPEQFGAKVFKISRDEQGNRLSHVKITGGSLKVKEVLENGEKADQLRQYQGTSFTLANEVFAGDICSIKGPLKLNASDGLGFEEKGSSATLTACLMYQMILPDKCDPFAFMNSLRQLEEEDPQLHFIYRANDKQIFVHLMGEIQTEVLKQNILDRFKTEVDFDHGTVRFAETIAYPVEGAGHFEPLRHYAEVHLLLEPLPKGSGILVESRCSTDQLKLQHQNLILSHLSSADLTGVLTNAPLTDIKITLLSGKDHEKHTEGQDFLEAAFRALRHGLMNAESILMEPVYRFEIEVDANDLSRVLFDLETMNAQVDIQTLDSGRMLLSGQASVRSMQNYQITLASITHGNGKMSTRLDGMQNVPDQNELVQASGYNPDHDLEHPSSSVFCKHGAALVVPWYEADDFMHLPFTYNQTGSTSSYAHNRYTISNEELEAVMNRTHKKKERELPANRIIRKEEVETKREVIMKKPKTKCLLVDGYNMIYSWDSLKEIAQTDLHSAREALIRMLGNYQGYQNDHITIVVFDAYKVEQNPGISKKLNNLYIVFTKTSQTADSYIEKTTHRLAKEFEVTVATSDNLEQMIVMQQGALRLSAREFEAKIKNTHSTTMKQMDLMQRPKVRPLADLKEKMEKLES
ncbi:MAG: TetM/TetW/TetO/TetS family tetracycline resistance ribosomal protection protein [Erysipelotrichaceae bacterium]|nr:TetM/TetW/TetO/TetS family tetracycline resistance ribosomal protection protein [Erysipelotrichaceae bacterium]